MVSGVTKILLAIIFALMSQSAIGQLKSEVRQPPTLKNGKPFASFIRLEYSQVPNSFQIFTIKFKISNRGTLDTLSISDNAPTEFAKSVKRQLAKLNEQWKPEYTNGHLSLTSKWLVIRFYVAGYVSDTTECIRREEAEFVDAYQREADLFQCSVKIDQPLRCLTDYLEGYDYFLYPPGLSRVEQ